MLARRKEAGAARSGLFGRLHAWWEGYEPDAVDGGVGASADDERSDVAPGELKTWTRRRLRAAQRLCGAGNSYPGGASVLAGQLDALPLADDQTVAVVGAGLGEIARHLIDRAGVQVNCIDSDRVLVQAAKELIDEAELGARINVQQANVADEVVGQQSCDVIVVKEALLEVENKADALRTLNSGLKPGGSLLLFEFVDRSGSGAPLDLSVWSAFERTQPHLVAMDEISGTLTEFGYEVAESVDISETCGRAILTALHEFAVSLDEKPVSDDLRPWVLWEVEYWARRAQILEGGDIGYCAIRATAG